MRPSPYLNPTRNLNCNLNSPTYQHEALYASWRGYLKPILIQFVPLRLGGDVPDLEQYCQVGIEVRVDVGVAFL